jgi:hypothetical protein
VIENFQHRGILHVERGRIIVVDRDALAEMSCECYEIIKDTYAQVGG